MFISLNYLKVRDKHWRTLCELELFVSSWERTKLSWDEQCCTGKVLTSGCHWLLSAVPVVEGKIPNAPYCLNSNIPLEGRQNLLLQNECSPLTNVSLFINTETVGHNFLALTDWTLLSDLTVRYSR